MHQPPAIHILAWLLLLATAACAAPEGSKPVTVAKALGSHQCQGGGTPLPALQRQLTEAGIAVQAARCGIDGLMHPMFCGADDGRLALFDIPAAQLAAAQELGFAPASRWPDARPGPCPDGGAAAR